ncbi:Nif3-like dinuclear metal center hexameric protein [Halobacillus sp. Marseille-Q1614]|uniref:Nif3-like dinuclear metal center hexameric protein n=1 Tax=Halobacillus sp. Marseille-Q1614 TaxID=2709134 RepID=UPI00156D4437|nr:Nif3-like dinuclear metal center hexameric protein [Halobacillus sp. Marseille-Q1614]
MTVTVREVVQQLDKLAPKNLAFEWDNVGLQLGSLDQKVENVMVTLDVLEDVVEEAVEKNVNLIVAHHPLLFKKLHQIDFSSPKGRVIRKLIQHDITVYAAHTNLDIAQGGVNDAMAELLQLQDVQPLIETTSKSLVKLAVYVPVSHADQVRDAISEAGAGHIGDYSHCTYQVKGEGTFKPLDGSDPYIGSQGSLERVEENRIETIMPSSLTQKVLKAMIEAHPYEEAAYDLFPLLNEGASLGVGRIGELENEMSLYDLCSMIKEKYQVPQLRYSGDANQKVKKVALLGGSGESYYKNALSKGADVYITGDMTFHTAQDAVEAGLALIDPGHHVEKVVHPFIKDCIEKNVPQVGTVLISNTDTEPFRFM